MKAKLNERTS